MSTAHISFLAAVANLVPNCKFYFTGSGEMFGRVEEVPQREATPFHPDRVMGLVKISGFELTRNYSEAYNLFACNGILFNHESPRRGYEFVTRKNNIGSGKDSRREGDELRLGNLRGLQ
jgi:GDPmannose 4,6-dehydratase